MNFNNLESSSTVIKNYYEDINEENIMNNVIEKINLIKYDFIDDIINDIVNNAIFNITELKNSKLERAEIKLINKIYEKFGVQKKSEYTEIDLVYTYINYNDKNYLSSVKNLEIKNLDPKLLNSYKELKENFHNFLLNVEITKKNLPFIRNIYIITPNYDFIDEIEKYIVVPIEDIYGEDKYNKNYFKPNIIIQYLTELKGLSNLFLFGSQDTIAVRNINLEDYIENNVPIIYLKKKVLNNDCNVNNIEEYNTVKLFEEKFETNIKLSNTNQITFIRKDVIAFTKKLFKSNINIDFLLLQYLTGYFFYLYNIKTSSTNYSSFSSNTQKLLTERLNMIKFKKVDFFAMNYLSTKYISYYLHACMINLDIIENKIIKNVFFLIDKNDKKLKYILPGIEKSIQGCVEININFFIAYDDNIIEYNGKFGECIYLVFGSPQKRWQYLKHIVIEMNENICLSDVLFFMNVESKMLPGDKINVFYPPKVMNKLEEKYSIPFTRILKMNNNQGVKICNIVFKNTSS